MSKSAVRLKDVTFGYRENPLFENLSLSFPSGKFISIIGPNGSGKTTLIRTLIGSLQSRSGHLFYHEKDAHHLKRREQAKHISFVPQSGRIEWELSVYECVAMGRYAHRSRMAQLQEEDIAHIEKSLLDLGLSELKDRLVTELSGGEYQRMLIARALAQNASVIALDEPVSHLDIHHQVEILALLKKLTVEKGVTVITVLHDLNAASEFSDRIILLDNGRVAAEGSADDVLTEERIKEVYKVSIEIIERKNREKSSRLILPRWSV